MSYSLRQRPAYGGNYTKGRQGLRANKIVIHHAATTSFDGIARTFQTPGRQASAHYGVGSNKNVDQYVHDNDTAWHAGNWTANVTSIGIENVNATGAPGWKIADQTFATLVELCRDLAKKHGLGKLVVGKNLFGHKDFVATACPGSLYGRLHELADRANSGVASSKPTSAPRPSGGGKKSLDQIASDVIAGKWGNGPDRFARLKAAGYDVDAVQKKVNQRLGVASSKPASKPAQSSALRVGSTVTVTNAVDYNGQRLGVSGNYTVMEIHGNRAVIGRGGAVTAAINTANIRVVGGGSAPAKKSADTIADEVIRGEWGNGPDRARKLNAAGWNANTIQQIVNRKLGA